MIGIRALSRTAVAAVAYYTAVVLLLHFLEPGLDPVANPMSAYVGTESGALMTTTYLVMAAGLVCLAIGLRHTLPATAMSNSGWVLLILAAIASGVAGAFPGEAPRRRLCQESST